MRRRQLQRWPLRQWRLPCISWLLSCLQLLWLLPWLIWLWSQPSLSGRGHAYRRVGGVARSVHSYVVHGQIRATAGPRRHVVRVKCGGVGGRDGITTHGQVEDRDKWDVKWPPWSSLPGKAALGAMMMELDPIQKPLDGIPSPLHSVCVEARFKIDATIPRLSPMVLFPARPSINRPTNRDSRSAANLQKVELARGGPVSVLLVQRHHPDSGPGEHLRWYASTHLHSAPLKRA
mmetsp:Transcript_42153/g.95241  ORF Transcript_42153/g.95241 Transcript_42153/m.95241 type:complete len:233 (+) Transcript_42153:458-1156(+)